MKARLWYKRKILIILFVFLMGFAVYTRTTIHAWLLDGFRPVMSSFTKAGYAVSNILDVFLHSSRRAEEIRQLRMKNRMLEAERALGEHIKRENEELRAMMGRENDETQFVYARVVGHSSSRVDDFLVVDVGEREGVKEDMPVLVAEGTIQIGTIAKVASRTSIIRLVSHGGEKTSILLPESTISSVATGQGGGVIEIQVPASIPVREGEPVFSVGLADYLLGYVEQIEKSDAGPFQIARFTHPVTITDVRRVYIVVSESHE